jgi:hypothetical protein
VEISGLINQVFTTNIKADIRLDGNLKVVTGTEPSKKKDGGSDLGGLVLNNPLEPNRDGLGAVEGLPGNVGQSKMNIGENENELGGMSLLRKTLFKKHYAGKTRFGEPPTMKGNIEEKNFFPFGV